MPVATPDWLKQRDGELKASRDGHSFLVYFGPTLEYAIVPTPSKGKHACKVTQTVSGRRLDKGGVWPTREAALLGGLDDLRNALGW